MSFKVTLACEDSYQSTWFTCSPPDSPGSSVFHLFSPNSPVIHPIYQFSLTLLPSTWLTCFPPDSPIHPISPVFTWFTCSPNDSPVFLLIHLFPPDLPVFARFHPFSPNSPVLHPMKRSNSLWHYACDNTREGIYQRELPARPPPSKEGPQNPPDKCPAKIKGEILKYCVITWPPKITFLFLDTFFNASGTCDALKEPVLKISF